MGSQCDLAQKREGSSAHKFWRRSEPETVCRLTFIDIPPCVPPAKLSQTLTVRNYARARRVHAVTGRGNPWTKDGKQAERLEYNCLTSEERSTVGRETGEIWSRNIQVIGAWEEVSESCKMYPRHRERYTHTTVSMSWLCMSGMGDNQKLVASLEMMFQIPEASRSSSLFTRC
ncbi:hypothetical protein CRENBAI_019968 [Crenichthys baileyi]|uniref:Uncharacterized protein n=1 Tax=Crenichthys baileyi TaxID=28760 RepID=A0AAV9QPW7_9TELE